MNRERLDGKIAVVVGVGGVIGDAVVERFTSEGATVIGIDRTSVESDAAEVLVADMRDEQQVIDAVATIANSYGRIDVLYNNVGPIDANDHALETNSVETWDHAFRNVLLPVVLSCKHVVPVMRSNDGGSIINTGSFLAGMGSATAQTAFSATKAAVVQLSRDLGTHLARSGVRVNSLSIGPVETPQTRRMFEQVGPDGLKVRLGHIPTRRFASPTEIAGVAAFLASSDAGYITATDVPVDGGIRGAYTVPD